jgi:RNA polymerase sigma factor (TIGR02999 family)
MKPDISQLLVRWSAGEEGALNEITPLVYGELRRLAGSTLRRNAEESILQPTALVHEAWVRMAGDQRRYIPNRPHFFALAAKIMRDILVDHLRRRRAAKRGGSQIEVALDSHEVSERPRYTDFLALDEALNRLGAIKQRYVRIAELRCLGGLTIEETAAVIAVSHATVEREWNFARAWLQRELRQTRSPRQP